MAAGLSWSLAGSCAGPKQLAGAGHKLACAGPAQMAQLKPAIMLQNIPNQYLMFFFNKEVYCVASDPIISLLVFLNKLALLNLAVLSVNVQPRCSELIPLLSLNLSFFVSTAYSQSYFLQWSSLDLMPNCVQVFWNLKRVSQWPFLCLMRETGQLNLCSRNLQNHFTVALVSRSAIRHVAYQLVCCTLNGRFSTGSSSKWRIGAEAEGGS